MNKKILLLLTMFLALAYFASADVTYRATFENNSVGGWGSTSIESTAPLNGSFSLKFAVVDNTSVREHGMVTNSTFNISFRFRHDILTINSCFRFGVTTLPHVLGNGIAIFFGDSNQCNTGGTVETIWVTDTEGSATAVQSGNTTPEATTGPGINFTIEINATKSGDATDTVWRLWKNDYLINTTGNNPTVSTWFQTPGTTPVRKFRQFFYRDGSNNAFNFWLDDIRVYRSEE